METHELIWVLFRVGSALLLTGTSLWVGYLIRTGHVRPIIVWRYVLAVLVANTVYRWLIVWLLLVENTDLYAQFQAWIGPFTQSMLSLLVMAIIVMTWTHVSAVRRHYRDHHE